jgi:hypothetical protein
MKRLIVCLFLIAALSGIAFSQDSDDWLWGGTVRFKPAATVFGLLSGGLEVVAAWVPYASPNFGIPIEIDAGTVAGIGFVGMMTGFEAISAPQKEKNGLFFTALAGPVFIANTVSYGAKADIGYHTVTDSGFVFTPAIGVKYYGFSGFALDIMLDIGFAYRKNKS